MVNNYVLSINMINKDNIWFGTWSGGVSNLDTTSATGVVDLTSIDVTLYPIPVKNNLTISFPSPQFRTVLLFIA